MLFLNNDAHEKLWGKKKVCVFKNVILLYKCMNVSNQTCIINSIRNKEWNNNTRERNMLLMLRVYVCEGV